MPAHGESFADLPAQAGWKPHERARQNPTWPVTRVEIVEERVRVGRYALTILHPRDPEALIDEERFAEDEFLPYWAELWPSGVALARALDGRVAAGARVLELGCGLAVPSIVAALGGGRVLATDWSPEAVAFAEQNARRNGARLETAVVSWTGAESLVERGRWDAVVASDLLYEDRNAAPLASLLSRLVDERGRILLADPGRPAARTFLDRAAADWRIQRLAPDAEHPRVELYELTRAVA